MKIRPILIFWQHLNHLKIKKNVNPSSASPHLEQVVRLQQLAGLHIYIYSEVSNKACRLLNFQVLFLPSVMQFFCFWPTKSQIFHLEQNYSGPLPTPSLIGDFRVYIYKTPYSIHTDIPTLEVVKSSGFPKSAIKKQRIIPQSAITQAKNKIITLKKNPHGGQKTGR